MLPLYRSYLILCIKYHTQEIFGGKIFWQTIQATVHNIYIYIYHELLIQVKAIGEEKLANKLQLVHMPNIFLVYV